jgi:hypothetical protein
VRKKPNTRAALTALGRERIAHHWEQLERLKSLAGTTSPETQKAAQPSGLL